MNEQNVTTTVETITPKQAEHLLANCNFDGQRKLRGRYADDLAKLMGEGKFGLSTLRIAVVGQYEYLIDGQHRLSGVAKSGVPIPFVVIREHLTSERDVQIAYSQIDGGINRRLTDITTTLGIANRIGVPEFAVTKAQGAINVMANDFEYSTSSNAFKGWTKQERAELPLRFKDEIYSYWRFAMQGNSKTVKGVSLAPVMAVGLATFRYQPEKAQEFWHGAVSTDVVNRMDPLFHLYELLLTLPGSKTPIEKTTRYVAGCWNNFILGKHVGFVKAHVSLDVSILGTPWESQNRKAAKWQQELNALFAIK